MTFIFKYSLQGTTPQILSLPCAVQNNAANALGINAAGYIDSSSDSTAADLVTLVGVTESAVDNSGGSVGDLNIPMVCMPDVVYETSASDGMVAANVFKTVAANTGGLTVISDTASTTKTGVFKILKLVSTTYLLGVVKYAGPMA
jgi:hypothetical protein